MSVILLSNLLSIRVSTPFSKALIASVFLSALVDDIITPRIIALQARRNPFSCINEEFYLLIVKRASTALYQALALAY
jgi:hypothetical protein